MGRPWTAVLELGLGHADPVPSLGASPKGKMARWISEGRIVWGCWEPKRKFRLRLSESCRRQSAATSRGQCSPALVGRLPECHPVFPLYSPHRELPQPIHHNRVRRGTSGLTRLHPWSQTPGATRSSAPLVPERKTFLPSCTSPPTPSGLLLVRRTSQLLSIKQSGYLT